MITITCNECKKEIDPEEARYVTLIGFSGHSSFKKARGDENRHDFCNSRCCSRFMRPFTALLDVQEGRK